MAVLALVRCWQASSSGLDEGAKVARSGVALRRPDPGPCGESWPGRSAARRCRVELSLPRLGRSLMPAEARRCFPLPRSDRSATVVEPDGRPAAILIHGPAVLSDQALLDAVAAAVQLESANARLRAEVRAQIAELAASRRRILEDGAGRASGSSAACTTEPSVRLADCAGTLYRCRLRRDGPADQGQDLARPNQRHASRGGAAPLAAGSCIPEFCPSMALAGGLARLARRTPPVPVEISGREYPAPPHAGAAYLVCSEGLRTSRSPRRHRGRRSLYAGRRDDRDRGFRDGVGGADPRTGSGLTGLADRVEVLGGTFRVESTPGRGTRLAAEIPLGGQER